jgi:hypothetical protein
MRTLEQYVEDVDMLLDLLTTVAHEHDRTVDTMLADLGSLVALYREEECA